MPCPSRGGHLTLSEGSGKDIWKELQIEVTSRDFPGGQVVETPTHPGRPQGPQIARGEGSLGRKCSGLEMEGECGPPGKPTEPSGLDQGLMGGGQ